MSAVSEFRGFKEHSSRISWKKRKDQRHFARNGNDLKEERPEIGRLANEIRSYIEK